MSRPPKPCQNHCGRPARKRRGAVWCSPCVAKIAKKTCSVCSGQFAPDMMRGPRCAPCASQKAHDKRVGETYGLGPGQYAQLLAFQGGVSAIGKHKPVTKRLAVDHDHKTGEVRGLLTKHENFYLLGYVERFDDPIAVLQAAIDYLRLPPARRLWGNAVPRQPPA